MLALLLPSCLAAQTPASGVPTARAVRTTTAITLDGLDREAVWRAAPITDDFKQFSPIEAGPARFRTAFQVAHDDRAVYVFLRMYDPRPDSLVALLSRRDVRTPSEWIKIVIDGFHDRRSGMQFMVNPAGVKRDANITNDVQEDGSWDAVWDVAVQTDSLGWTAEYAIPFSQLRYNPAATLVFGFGIWRDVARYGERDAWPTYRGSMQTFASQLGDLVASRVTLGLRPALRSRPKACCCGCDHPPPTAGSVTFLVTAYGITSIRRALPTPSIPTRSPSCEAKVCIDPR